MSVVIELSMFPLDKGESLSPYVARLVRIIEDSGLDYSFGPMATSIEGDYDRVMEVVRSCFRELEKDCRRIHAAIRMDYRADSSGRLLGKVSSVKEKLQGP
jgi:uncharacterized protein (TIGR00106 family)